MISRIYFILRYISNHFLLNLNQRRTFKALTFAFYIRHIEYRNEYLPQKNAYKNLIRVLFPLDTSTFVLKIYYKLSLLLLFIMCILYILILVTFTFLFIF